MGVTGMQMSPVLSNSEAATQAALAARCQSKVRRIRAKRRGPVRAQYGGAAHGLGATRKGSASAVPSCDKTQVYLRFTLA